MKAERVTKGKKAFDGAIPDLKIKVDGKWRDDEVKSVGEWIDDGDKISHGRAQFLRSEI